MWKIIIIIIIIKLEQKQTNNSNISSELQEHHQWCAYSSYVVQAQKRSGGLTNVNFKVLFGNLKSSLIGLRKQLSNVAVSHYKGTLYIQDLKTALDVIISSEKSWYSCLITVTNSESLMSFPETLSILYKWCRHNLLRSL